MLGGLVSAGLGLLGLNQSNKQQKASTKAQLTGYNYLRGNENVQQAQDMGLAAANQRNDVMGLLSALLGIGGDPAAAQQGFDQFRDSTGYDFRLNQGMDAITGNRAARGILMSGATGKELMGYGQNLASAEFQNYLNSLRDQVSMNDAVSNTGLDAAYRIGAAGSAAGAGVANSVNQGYQNRMNSIGGIAGGLMSAFGR